MNVLQDYQSLCMFFLILFNHMQILFHYNLNYEYSKIPSIAESTTSLAILSNISSYDVSVGKTPAKLNVCFSI